MEWTVRAAGIDDAPAIAAVHVATWRTTYAGIVPQAHLDALSVEERTARWQRAFVDGKVAARTAIWVADDRRVVGFVNVGPSRDLDTTGLGEVRAIYVLASHWDKGVGHALHARGIASLREVGFAAATLWVLEANVRARAFYERHGWRPDETRQMLALVGGDVAEVRYRLELVIPRGARRRGASC